MTSHYPKEFTQPKPKKRHVVGETTFKRSGDEVWLELNCGHYVRKIKPRQTNATRRGETGIICDACVSMGALN